MMPGGAWLVEHLLSIFVLTQAKRHRIKKRRRALFVAGLLDFLFHSKPFSNDGKGS